MRDADESSVRSDPGDGRFGTFAFLTVVVLFIGIRFWHLSYYCLDGDEIFSLAAARSDWAAMLAAVVADLVHPPFSYVVLKTWIWIGGESTLWLRLLPTLLSIFSVIPFLLICRQVKVSSPATSLALYLTAVNGYLVYWSHDIRMYSLLLFITLLSYWLFIRFYRTGNDGYMATFSLLLINLLLIYTHYFGWFVVGVQFVFLLFFARNKLRMFLPMAAIWVVAFAPWAYVIKTAADARSGFGHNLGWIVRPGFRELIWFYETLNGDVELPHTTLIGITAFAVPALLMFLNDVRNWKKHGRTDFADRWLLVAACSLPVLAAFIGSKVLPQSIWGERHLIIAAVPYFVVVADGVIRSRPLLLRNTAIAVIVVWSGIAGSEKLAENNRPAWDHVTSEMIAAEPADTWNVTLYTNEEVIDPILEFYIAQANDVRFHVENVESVDAMEGDHFWVALRTATGRPEDRTPELLVSRGYRIGAVQTSETPLEKVRIFPVWKE